MEKCGAWGSNVLVSELAQGQELMRQLKALLEHSSTPPQCRLLAQSIQSSLEKAISMAKSDSGGPAAGGESPRSDSWSPRSENSERVLKDQERREMCKKRKTLPKWTDQVRVCSGTALEGPPDDGFSWRKYGQKDILGAKHPRGYYRCTHRNAQGCLATKQVQRSDKNPSVFDITYRGTHTCVPRGSSSPAPAQRQQPTGNDSPNLRSDAEQPFLLSFKAGLTVKTEGLDDHDLASAPFSFRSTPVASCGKAQEGHVFSSPSTPLDAQYGSSFPPTFISPAASGSSYFPVSPCQGSVFGGIPNFQAPKSDLTEIVPADASATSSPVFDLDIILNAEFDPSFPFDASIFL